MWVPVLLMAVAVSLEPFRIGMTVLMLNRPRPVLQLLAFLGGGFAMGLTVGLVVLFGLRPAVLGSGHVTLPRVQIGIGVLALVMAALLAANVIGRQPVDRVEVAGSGGLATRARRLMRGRSLWVAGAAGLGIALPSVDYLAALALILASGAAAGTQVAALLLFNAVAFALVEIPLLAYLAAPDRTRAAMSALDDWIRTRRRRDVAAVLVVAGIVLIAVGWAEG